MTGYPSAPSYGGADPRWPANQPVGYEPNMPYHPYNLNQAFLPPRPTNLIHNAPLGDPYMKTSTHQFAASNQNIGYTIAGDSRFLQSQLPRQFPQTLQDPKPPTLLPNNSPSLTEGVQQTNDAMDLDSKEEGELSSYDDEVNQANQNPESRAVPRPFQSSKPHAQMPSDLQRGDVGARFVPNKAQPTKSDARASQQEESSQSGQASCAKSDAHHNSRAGKTASQLRVLAQGALLNLAPHKIRYNELVKEGIDATILKRLYDEIGIKIMADTEMKTATSPSVSTGLPVAQNSLHNDPGTDSANAILGQSKASLPTTNREGTTLKKDKEGTPVKSHKPMERKDVIASMLAAKAAKIAAIAANTAATEMAICPSNENTPPSTQNTQRNGRDEVRTKEKSKAQTELARQRMEQLRKLGLSKFSTQTPTLPTTPTITPTSTIDSTAKSTPLAQQEPPSLSHPLPDRPPQPGEVAATRIPGLVMTSSDSSNVDSLLSNNQSQNEQESVPESVSRIPRKRPRASDFTDDLVELPVRKHSTAISSSASVDQRVVIDISDDEAIHVADGREVGIQGIAQAQLRSPRTSLRSATQILPPFSDTQQRNYNTHRSIPVVVPNTFKPAAHGLLEKNKEIQAMRQKIAELEARRGKKQTSTRNGNLEALNDSNLAAINESQVQQEAENSSSELENARITLKEKEEQALNISNEESASNSMAGSTPTTGASPSLAETSRVASPQLSSNSDPQRAEETRLRALRRKEIESGLPLLDAELLKTEQKLAEFREQEKKLLEQIAKGREGKRRLIAELEALGVETEGLSMAELKDISNDLESTKENLTQVDLDLAVPHMDQASQHSDYTSTITVDTNACFPAGDTAPENTLQADDEPQDTVEQQDVVQDIPLPELQDLRDDSYSSSAMDESMGSSEDESSEQLAHKSGPSSPASAGDEATTTSRALSSEPEKDHSLESPLEERSTFQTHDLNDEENPCPTTRETSILSDGYEPPEPDMSLDDNTFRNSPPFSPAPPKPVEIIPTAPQNTVECHDSQILTASNHGTAEKSDLESSSDNANIPSSSSNYRFDPYNSPLHFFKAYRYHPNFTELVDGGFRSLTYSHKIDPHKPLCDLEITGGVCDSPSCGFQHFRDMNLSDDKILVEMGSLREGKTPAEREEYVTGLKQIINDMRRDKVKDFAIVAKEIAAYRRRFLQDPSRVLAL